MDQASRDLLVTFVASFRPYLRERLAERDWPSIPEAVQRGSEWLGRSLDQLLSQPYALQRRTPLELFQEALAPANEALEAAGVPVPVRDTAAVAALPGDHYDLAPASSAALGEEAWRVHIAWGVAKAAVVTRPAVALLAANLLDRDRIERVVVTRGLRLDPIRGASGVGGQILVLVDLTDPAADETITAAATAGVRTIGFGPHVDEFAMVRARSLGATQAMARSQFFRDLEGLLPELV